MKHFQNFLLAVILIALTLNSCNTKETVTETRPNIILVMADDQGWGDMAYNGHPVLQTPNFDNLSASGLRFDHFYAAAPVCSPTRGSVMTGRHPNRFGCFSWGHTLRPQEITIAEALQSAGYVTGHFGKWHLGSVENGSPVSPGTSGFDEWVSSPNFFDNDPILSREGTAVQMHGESSMVTTEIALKFIRKYADSEQPFFAVVWFGSPHAPYIAAKEDSALYPGLEPHLQHFYGEISGMDHAMGKLRQELKNLGIRNNTLLWYCSDNGGLPKVGATGGRGHKTDIYEGGLRVPAIIEWPAKYHNPEWQESRPIRTIFILPCSKLPELNRQTSPFSTGLVCCQRWSKRSISAPDQWDSGNIRSAEKKHRLINGCPIYWRHKSRERLFLIRPDWFWMREIFLSSIRQILFPVIPPGSTGRGNCNSG